MDLSPDQAPEVHERFSVPVGTAVRAWAPASSANLGPGFDSIGMALGIWDSYEAGVVDQPGLRIEIEGDDQGVPRDERHLVYASMRRALLELGAEVPGGLVLRCASTVRQGRGMGSSAAAISGGIALAFGLVAVARAGASAPAVGQSVEIDLARVNDLASRLEGHPDNASACVLGGVTVSWVLDDRGDGADPEMTNHTDNHTDNRTYSSAQVPLHPSVEPFLVVPVVQLPTATARAVLPPHVPHGEAARNSGAAALLVFALSHRPDLLMPATREWLHQEQRRSSLGGAMELVDRLREQGLAAVISGAGPSVLVLGTAEQTQAVEAACAPFASQGWRVLRPGVPTSGVRVERVSLGMPSGGEVSLT